MSSEHRQANLYERALKAFGRTSVGKWYARIIPPLVDPQMLRLTGGWISNLYPLPVMLLTTIGARTRQSRTQPLVYLTDDAGLILVASNFGRPHNPAWYRNLLASPKVEVLAGRDSGTYESAEITDPAEREHPWSLALDMYAGWAEYQDQAGARTIPLIRLERTHD